MPLLIRRRNKKTLEALSSPGYRPNLGNPNNSEYNNLQPGLRVTSAYFLSDLDTFLSTTCGVLVRDQVGNKFMTAAAYGFPGECGTQVIHPQSIPRTCLDRRK